MITENYVSFEIAKLLKEKGFDEKIDTVYSEYGELHRIFDKDFYESTNSFITIANSNYNNITKYKYDFFVTVPTLQMAMKWLREKHKIDIEIHYNRYEENYRYLIIYKPVVLDDICSLEVYFHYEEASEAVIKYCLEYLI